MCRVSREFKVLLQLAVTISIWLGSQDALAVHKNWLLKNGGGQCAFAVPSGTDDDTADAFLWNNSSLPRFASCPLALSARWGSSSPSVSVPRWAGAWAANVYVNNQQPGENFHCTARARLGSGSDLNALFYSRAVGTTLEGDQRLRIASAGDWGNVLETNDSKTIRSLDFECRVPGNSSSIYGYKVRICHVTSGTDCQDPGVDEESNHAHPSATETGMDWVQTSGIECTAQGASPLIERGDFGIRANGSGGGVFCPIVPAADDTWEVHRTLQRVTVHYVGGPGWLMCQLLWRDRYPFPSGNSGWTYWSNNFANPLVGEARLENFSVGWDISMAVWCDLPGGTTLQGVTTRMTVADVSAAP
jgi:hypothetical protein